MTQNKKPAKLKPIKPSDINKSKVVVITTSPADLWRLHEYRNNHIAQYELSNSKLYDVLINRPLEHWRYSGIINRYSTAASLAYRINLDTVDTITVLYKIKDIQQTDKEVTYSMAYAQVKPKEKSSLYIEILEKLYGTQLSISNNIYIQEICPSGSMISKDGEYRSGMLNWNHIQVVLERNAEVRALFDHILDYFTDALKERKYILLTEYYFPTDKMKNRYQFETELLCSSTKIHFFCIVWFNFYYSYYFGFISNHINAIFKQLLLKYKKDDLAFFKGLWKKFSYNIIEDFRYICGNNVTGYDDKFLIYNKIKVGQKIIPLNLIEAQHFFNIEYDPWKEYFIGEKVSDLVMNNISNGFALMRGWMLIKNSDKYFYDNPSQADRLEKSKIALKIAEILTQAKLYTYNNINDAKDYIQENVDVILYNLSNDKRDITSWLSNEFKVLYSKIQDSINHSKETIIMSNVSINIISEYLGKTIYDAIFLTQRSSYYKTLVTNIFSVENHQNFKKYIFQICYNLYCLNTKLNVIHGDLHLNNITLNSIFYKKNVNIGVKNPHILYILDKENQYIFEHNFYDLCLIDFSRAIINPEYVERFKLDHIPYELITSKNHFLEKQVTALLEYLYSSKPEFKEFGPSIETSMRHHYSEYFKILSVLDLYNVTSKFIDFLKNQYKDVKNPHKDSVKLIYDINKSADYYLSIVLNKLISHRNFNEVEEMEWPIVSIIKDVFDQDNASNFGPSIYKSIIDVYNYNNELKHSLSTIKKFPTVLKEKKKMVDGKVVPAQDAEVKLLESSIKRSKIYENKTFKNFQIINTIIKRQLEKNI
jgi:hypothetical protein